MTLHQKRSAGDPCVWIINQYAYTPDQAAGTRHFSFAKQLRKDGYDALVISSSFYHKHRRQDHYDPSSAYKVGDVEGVPFVWLRTPSYNSSIGRVVSMLAFSARLFGSWRANYREPDFILSTSPSPFSALASGILARSLGARWIVEIVDLWPDTLIQIGGMSHVHPLVVLLRAIEKYLYRRSDAVMTHLPAASAHFQELGAAPSKTFYLPSPTPFDLPETPPQYASESTFKFMYVGAMGQANVLHILINAFAIAYERGSLQNTELHLVGEGPKLDDLRRLVCELGIDAQVIFHGQVPKHTILECLSTADACVLLSGSYEIYRYGISFNKMFDYMAAAKPIIASTNARDTPIEIANAGIMVPPEDVEKLADAMVMLAEMTASERAEMGRRGYAHLLEHHTLGAWGSRFDAMLSEVCGRD